MLYLGSINLYFFLYAIIWGIFAKLGLARPVEHTIAPKHLIAEMSRRRAVVQLEALMSDKEKIKLNDRL